LEANTGWRTNSIMRSVEYLYDIELWVYIQDRDDSKSKNCLAENDD